VKLDLDSEPASLPVAANTPSGHRHSNGAHEALLECFAEEVRADAAWLLVREGPRSSTRLVSGWDRSGRGEPQRPLDGEFLARLLDGGNPILEPVNGAAADPALPLAEHEASIEHVLGAAAPSPDGVEAILCAKYEGQPGPPRTHLLWTAESFAAAAALCLTDAGGLRDALSWPRRDPLTGCLSYAGLVEALAEEIDRSTRNHHRLSCCFLDLDGFKQVNRVAGHLAGNRRLAAIGAALQAGVRTYDVVGRFGGDEFVVILPETGARSAGLLAERLRRGLRPASLGATNAPVEVSIGTAEWAAGMSADDLLETADRSLRVAKDRGGSMVVSASSPDQAVESILEIFESVTELMGTEPELSRDRRSRL